MKTCIDCKEMKPISEFWRNKAAKDEHRAECGICSKKRWKNWVEKNPEKAKNRWKKENRFAHVVSVSRWAAKKYDCVPCVATKEELEAAFTGKCHVCGVPEKECNQKLHMDHCHESGKFRGWLCMDCNLALGKLKDSPERILALAEYVERATVLTPNPQ